jgi:hypothetical protein
MKPRLQAPSGLDPISTEARAERRRERAVRGARSDDDRAGGIDAAATAEREREARERRPAPARRGSSGMRAERRLDRA